MSLIRVVQLISTSQYDGWDYYEDKYDLNSYSDQYSTGWEEVDEEKLKEIQKTVQFLNNNTRLKYAIIRTYNSVEINDLIAQAKKIELEQEKAFKAREAARKANEAKQAEKIKIRKLKQLEKLKKELNEA